MAYGFVSVLFSGFRAGFLWFLLQQSMATELKRVFLEIGAH